MTASTNLLLPTRMCHGRSQISDRISLAFDDWIKHPAGIGSVPAHRYGEGGDHRGGDGWHDSG